MATDEYIDLPEEGGGGGGGGTPGGSLSDVQFNAGGGNFGGNSNFTTDGSGNVSATGAIVGQTLDQTSNQIWIGPNAGFSVDPTVATDSIFLGPSAGFSATSAYNSFFALLQAGMDSPNANYSNIIGFQAGVGMVTLGSHCNLFGYQAGNATNGTDITAIGQQAGFQMSGSSIIAIGYNAAASATNFDHSVAIGHLSGADSAGSGNNVYLGFESGLSSAMNTSIAIGNEAGSGANGFEHILIGDGAGSLGSSGTYHISIGSGAGSSFTGATAINIGFNAGAESIASQAIFLGVAAGASSGANDLSNSIFIGYSAGIAETINNSGSDSSILIGNNTSTGGFKNSIAIGTSVVNTAVNQIMLGPTGYRTLLGAPTDDTISTLNINGLLAQVQQTTPTTFPNSGSDFLYFKSDDNLYAMNSAGTEIQINGGGGGSAASPDTSIQFNNSGSFGGSASLTYDSGNITLLEGDLNVLGAGLVTNLVVTPTSNPGAPATGSITFPLPTAITEGDQIIFTDNVDGPGPITFQFSFTGTSGGNVLVDISTAVSATDVLIDFHGAFTGTVLNTWFTVTGGSGPDTLNFTSNSFNSGYNVPITGASEFTFVGLSGGANTDNQSEYDYQVSALMGSQEGVGLLVITTTAASTLVPGVYFNTLTWDASPGATSYNIYSEVGGGLIGNTASLSFVDDGTASPVTQSPPFSDSTAAITNTGSLTVYGRTTMGGVQDDGFSTLQAVDGPTFTIAPVTAGTAIENASGTSTYTAGDTLTYQIYSTIVFNQVQVFAPTPFDPVPGTLTIATNADGVNLAWTAVSGATSYRILRQLNGDAQKYQDVSAPTVTLDDEGTDWLNNPVINPSTYNGPSITAGRVVIGATDDGVSSLIVSSVHIIDQLIDGIGSAGSGGQVLTTTGAEIEWVNANTLGLPAPSYISDTQNINGFYTDVDGSQFQIATILVSGTGTSYDEVMNINTPNSNLPSWRALFLGQYLYFSSVDDVWLLSPQDNQNILGLISANVDFWKSTVNAGLTGTYTAVGPSFFPAAVIAAQGIQLTLAGDLSLPGELIDSTNSPGVSGYILSSTGTATEWILNNSSLWTESAGTLFPTTPSDRVLIGGAIDDSSSMLQILGTTRSDIMTTTNGVNSSEAFGVSAFLGSGTSSTVMGSSASSGGFNSCTIMGSASAATQDFTTIIGTNCTQSSFSGLPDTCIGYSNFMNIGGNQLIGDSLVGNGQDIVIGHGSSGFGSTIVIGDAITASAGGQIILGSSGYRTLLGLSASADDGFSTLKIGGVFSQVQQTTPGSVPSTGSDFLYFKSDDNLYAMNSGGTEIQINGVGSGIWTESVGTLFPTTTSDRVLIGGATDDGISALQVAGAILLSSGFTITSSDHLEVVGATVGGILGGNLTVQAGENGGISTGVGGAVTFASATGSGGSTGAQVVLSGGQAGTGGAGGMLFTGGNGSTGSNGAQAIFTGGDSSGLGTGGLGTGGTFQIVSGSQTGAQGLSQLSCTAPDTATDSNILIQSGLTFGNGNVTIQSLQTLIGFTPPTPDGINAVQILGSVGIDEPQTTISGSIGGTAVWSMPFQGASYKKFLINLAAFNDAGETITYPVAFTRAPFIYGTSAVTTLASTTITQLTLTATIGAISGNLFVEGY